MIGNDRQIVTKLGMFLYCENQFGKSTILDK